MKIFVVDAFSEKPFSGNQAGVVLLDHTRLSAKAMQSLAAELRFSETAFVRRTDTKHFDIRYFTPLEEVELCGHATIASFFALQREEIISEGVFSLSTLSGNINVEATASMIWMEMPETKIIKALSLTEAQAIYQAYGLTAEDCPPQLHPAIVQSGLSDIILPVKDHSSLMKMRQDEAEIIRISKQHQVTGVHAFCLAQAAETVTAFCRNFAPAVGITEEAATGTSNAGLSFLLYSQGKIGTGTFHFIQGKSLGRTAHIYSRILRKDDKLRVQIGGQAVILMEGQLNKAVAES